MMYQPGIPLNLQGLQQPQLAGQQSQPMAQTMGMPEPFVWGAAGSKLTPEQLALRQKLALQNQQGDYSPIASPWQGLARVAQNVTGALDQKALDKESAAQSAASQGVITALTGGDPAAQKNAVAAALMGSDPVAQKLAFDVNSRLNPKPVTNDTVNDYNFRVQTLGQAAADDWLRRGNDPFVSVNTPTGFYAGPQSGLGGAMQASSTPALGAASVPQTGMVQDGYRFKGGDPADQKNWEAVR